MHARQAHARAQQARRTLQEHQPHRWVHQFERTVRARWQVGGAVCVALAEGPSLAIGVQCTAKSGLAQRFTMAHKLGPVQWPAQVDDRCAWQPERKVESAEPGAGACEQGFKGGPVGQGFDAREFDRLAVEAPDGGRDRLGPPRRRGEVDPDQCELYRPCAHAFRTCGAACARR